METSGATVEALGCVGSFPSSNRGLEVGSGVGDGGSGQPTSPPLPPGTVGKSVVRGVVEVVVVVGGTTRASPFFSWETSVGFIGRRRGLISADEGRLRGRGERVRCHAESPILFVRVELILWRECGA